MLIKELGKQPKCKTFEKKENAQFVSVNPPPLRVVNRQGISREWPPRIGERKKQNVSREDEQDFLTELSISIQY